jgi:hypothetical protein
MATVHLPRNCALPFEVDRIRAEQLLLGVHIDVSRSQESEWPCRYVIDVGGTENLSLEAMRQLFKRQVTRVDGYEAIEPLLNLERIVFAVLNTESQVQEFGECAKHNPGIFYAYTFDELQASQYLYSSPYLLDIQEIQDPCLITTRD